MRKILIIENSKESIYLNTALDAMYRLECKFEDLLDIMLMEFRSLGNINNDLIMRILNSVGLNEDNLRNELGNQYEVFYRCIFEYLEIIKKELDKSGINIVYINLIEIDSNRVIIEIKGDEDVIREEEVL